MPPKCLLVFPICLLVFGSKDEKWVRLLSRLATRSLDTLAWWSRFSRSVSRSTFFPLSWWRDSFVFSAVGTCLRNYFHFNSLNTKWEFMANTRIHCFIEINSVGPEFPQIPHFASLSWIRYPILHRIPHFASRFGDLKKCKMGYLTVFIIFAVLFLHWKW